MTIRLATNNCSKSDLAQGSIYKSKKRRNVKWSSMFLRIPHKKMEMWDQGLWWRSGMDMDTSLLSRRDRAFSLCFPIRGSSFFYHCVGTIQRNRTRHNVIYLFPIYRTLYQTWRLMPYHTHEPCACLTSKLHLKGSSQECLLSSTCVHDVCITWDMWVLSISNAVNGYLVYTWWSVWESGHKFCHGCLAADVVKTTVFNCFTGLSGSVQWY